MQGMGLFQAKIEARRCAHTQCGEDRLSLTPTSLATLPAFPASCLHPRPESAPQKLGALRVTPPRSIFIGLAESRADRALMLRTVRDRSTIHLSQKTAQ